MNRILELEEELVERFLSVCERFGNKIVDRLMSQLSKEPKRYAMALRFVYIFINWIFMSVLIDFLNVLKMMNMSCVKD